MQNPVVRLVLKRFFENWIIIIARKEPNFIFGFIFSFNYLLIFFYLKEKEFDKV